MRKRQAPDSHEDAHTCGRVPEVLDSLRELAHLDNFNHSQDVYFSIHLVKMATNEKQDTDTINRNDKEGCGGAHSHVESSAIILRDSWYVF